VKGHIGSTGKPHDWSISKEIVKNSSIPVILSGGLSPENVGEAIRTVKPDGVDACTSLDMNSEGRKDVEKVRRFIENAREEEVE
jgi:Phosphoribosylanthranilate isomerase